MRFVLDQNFPVQATGLPWPPGIEVTRLNDLDRRLTRDYEDWQIFLELNDRGDVDSIVTNDANILKLPTEMVALSKTKLILVVVDRGGDNPLRATGLIMVHMEQVARQTRVRPYIYVLRASELTAATPWQRINALARQNHVADNQMAAEEIAKIAQWESARRDKY